MPATAPRIEDARRAGEVAFSPDLIAATSLVAAWSVLAWAGAALVAGLVAYLHVGLARATTGQSAAQALGDAVRALMGALGWPLVTVAVAALLAGILQTGARGMPLSRRIRVMWGGFSSGRLLGRELAADVLFDVLKIGVLLAVAVASGRSAVGACVALPQVGPLVVGRAFAAIALQMGTRLVVAVVVLAVVDYGWRVLRHRHRLRMSHQEARREERETEGNPEHKAERRRLFRERVDVPALAEVGTADLLVVEPGVLAIAVAWRSAAAAAPTVVARAIGPQLPGLERVARQASVATCIDPSLARMLAFTVEGGEVPEHQYGALARAAVRAGFETPGFGRAAGGDGRAR